MALRLNAIGFDADDPATLGRWWAEALGWHSATVEDGDVLLTPPPGQGAPILFMSVPEAKTVKNRLHLDFTPDDQQSEVDRLIGLGARHVDIGQGEQTWVVLADPEGNEFCVLAPD